MSESFDWHSFLESVEALCRQVEHRIQLSDSNTLQDFLFRLQAKRTACERLIGAAVASGVDTSVSENVQGNVKRLSNVIQHLMLSDSYNQLTLPMDNDMPRINLKIKIQTHVTAFAPVSLFSLNCTSQTASFFFYSV